MTRIHGDPLSRVTGFRCQWGYHPDRRAGSVDVVKLRLSLQAADLAFLDRFATAHGIASRSAVLHYALDRLRQDELGDASDEAWDEWVDSEDAIAWELVIADQLDRS